MNSGRSSPYFFNTGICNDGHTLNMLASYYCQLIVDSTVNYDFIFGPAYKGITLATSISSILNANYKINKPYCFNRKESKQHGEKGLFVGYSPKGTAIIIDDVISSGKSIIDSIQLLNDKDVEVTAIFVAFDRMEKSNKIGSNKRASLEIKEKYGIEIFSLICLDDVLNYLNNNDKYKQHVKDMENYIDTYRR
ncbi:MAG: orotate phosphoribosyltransferase [Gammaproteobacteria bacterium]|nr:orotate phosphoribosyltransferase [Gammaproteobacteria bacterium]